MAEEMGDEDGKIVFVQGGVHLLQHASDKVGIPGEIQIRECSFAKFIEWKPQERQEKDAKVERPLQDCDWAVVNPTVGYKVEQADAVEIVSVPHTVHPIRIDIVELKSIHLRKHDHFVTLMQKDGSTCSPLLFVHCDAHPFIDALKTYIILKHSRRDRNLLLVNENEEEALTKSLSELDLFPSHSSSTTDLVWQFMQRPYETTMTNLSKLITYSLNASQEAEQKDDIAELLQQNLSTCKNGHTNNELSVAEESFEIVGTQPEALLAKRPAIIRECPLSIDEWRAFFDKDGRIVSEFGLKRRIFSGGVQPSIRKEVWKYLLGYYPYSSTSKERDAIKQEKIANYYRMKSQWISVSSDQELRFSAFRERKNLIEKDVMRTDRQHPYYSGDDNANVNVLLEILMTYVMYNFDLGYVQGMSDLLSPILFVMENEVDAFWCFVGLMEKVHRNFEATQDYMRHQLKQLQCLLQAVDPGLALHLEANDSHQMFFCFRWILVFFKREFIYEDIMTLWEVMWTDLPGKNFHLICCVAILDSERNEIIANELGFEAILKHVNDIAYHINLEKLLCNAEAIYQQLEAAAPELNDSVRAVLGYEPLSPAPAQGDQVEVNVQTTQEERRCSGQHGVSVSESQMSPQLQDADESKYEDGINLQYH